jgi:hypothetical protein
MPGLAPENQDIGVADVSSVEDLLLEDVGLDPMTVAMATVLVVAEDDQLLSTPRRSRSPITIWQDATSWSGLSSRCVGTRAASVGCWQRG